LGEGKRVSEVLYGDGRRASEVGLREKDFTSRIKGKGK
jgi:hypothetical protein